MRMDKARATRRLGFQLRADADEALKRAMNDGRTTNEVLNAAVLLYDLVRSGSDPSNPDGNGVYLKDKDGNFVRLKLL